MNRPLPDGLPTPARAARVAVALAALLLQAAPASASFHLAHISRVLTGLDGSTDVQFVEIEMESSGQHLITGSKLIAFDADGNFSHVVTVTPNNVQGGKDRPWLMASQGFADIAAITPDFVFDSTGGKGLFAEAGMVCWGRPSAAQESNPNSSVDCVSYGDYQGPANAHTSAPSPITPFGHGLVRVSDTGSSAADFACEDPALPRNNVPLADEIAATSPCTGCGNGAVEEPEDCDDGDTTHVAGDYCSAQCEAFGCGIPSSTTAPSPKTSDALFVLRAAVAVTNCDLRVCDVSGNGAVASSDALLILRRAVGQEVAFACPA